MENNVNKILVTGSNGLLGSALKKILGNNHIYHTRKDCDLKNSNETHSYITKQIKEHNINTIIHCAARVGGVQVNSNNNDGFFIDNYNINNNVIKSAFDNKISNFVNILSTCIFPNTNITYPLTPNQIDFGSPHPSNYGYSYAKRLSGYETKIFRNITGLNWFSVVPTNIYGQHDNFNLESSHLIPGLIHKAYLAKKNNEKFIIWGDGSQLRQFVYVEDLARLIIWSIDNWKSDEHCMLINETEISVKEIGKIIMERFQLTEDDVIFDTSRPSGQHRKPAISDVKDYHFKDIKDGINETIDWFINNFENVRK
jgi:GDP-L-fucose synthase